MASFNLAGEFEDSVIACPNYIHIIKLIIIQIF